MIVRKEENNLFWLNLDVETLGNELERSLATFGISTERTSQNGRPNQHLGSVVQGVAREEMGEPRKVTEPNFWLSRKRRRLVCRPKALGRWRLISDPRLWVGGRGFADPKVWVGGAVWNPDPNFWVGGVVARRSLEDPDLIFWLGGNGWFGGSWIGGVWGCGSAKMEESGLARQRWRKLGWLGKEDGSAMVARQEELARLF